jgi:hypothetical protein
MVISCFREKHRTKMISIYITKIESEIKHIKSELDKNMKPKMKSIDSYLILLERIKFTLEQMKIEASSIRASSDQTEKRIVEMEKGLNDNIQKVLNDTNILHSEIKGELSSTKFWLQIIVGGIVVGMLILIIQNFMQKKNESVSSKKFPDKTEKFANNEKSESDAINE